MKQRIVRLDIIGALSLVLVCGLLARAFQLQVVDYSHYSTQANSNMVHTESVLAPRGVIFDCRGRVLARNTARFTIRINRSQLTNVNRTLELIAAAVKMKPDRLASYRQALANNQEANLVISEALDDIALARFAEIQGNTPGVYLDVQPLREYPLGAIGAHILGYVGEIEAESLKQLKAKGYVAGEWIGKDGIEHSYEALLHGKAGYKFVTVDVNGQAVSETTETLGQAGSDLHLTIDARLQRRAEELLADTLSDLAIKNGEGSGGVVVAVEANTGYVRALASLPEYNPNWFSDGISSQRFSGLVNDKRAPLMNRAVSGAYPPGSTFKLITTSAALQEGVITPYTSFYCPGVFYVSGLPFNCFVTSGHGPLNLVECIAQSCDVSYYQMGTKLKLPRLHNYASLFGLGSLTNIDLPAETKGCFPYPGWKERQLEEAWYPGDDANTSIGQGFVSATPIQMAMATAVVANGGKLYRPLLLQRVVSAGTAQLSEDNLVNPVLVRTLPVEGRYFDIVRQGMRGAVTHGTAAGASDGIDMAGKTGTAENSATADNPYGRNHAWFTSFTPYAKPELVITVFLEKSGGYGGSLAAPIAYAVAKEWQACQAAKFVDPVNDMEDWDSRDE